MWIDRYSISVLHETMGYIKFLQDQVQVLSSPYFKHQHQTPTSCKSSFCILLFLLFIDSYFYLSKKIAFHDWKNCSKPKRRLFSRYYKGFCRLEKKRWLFRRYGDLWIVDVSLGRRRHRRRKPDDECQRVEKQWFMSCTTSMDRTRGEYQRCWSLVTSYLVTNNESVNCRSKIIQKFKSSKWKPFQSFTIFLKGFTWWKMNIQIIYEILKRLIFSVFILL